MGEGGLGALEALGVGAAGGLVGVDGALETGAVGEILAGSAAAGGGSGWGVGG